MDDWWVDIWICYDENNALLSEKNTIAIMVHFLWFLFNIALLLSFIYLFIGYLAVGKRIFPEKHKRVAVLFLGLGVLLTLNSFTKKESENTISFSKVKPSMHSGSFKTYTFQENPLFAVQLNLLFGKEDDPNVLFEATS